jgi:hypothetical protein
MKIKNLNIEENISRLVMVAIGVLCVGLSIWYTSSFFIKDSELPVVIAISLSTAIAIFNSFALAAATFLVHHKKWIMAVIFIPIWLATTAFDIFTVAGSQSYRFQISNQQTEQITQQSERTDLRFQLLQTDYDNALAEQQRLTSEIQSKNDIIRRYESELQELNSRRTEILQQEEPDIRNITTQITRTDNLLATAKRERDLLQGQLNTAKANAAEARSAMTEEINHVEETEIAQIASMPVKVSFANWLHQVFPSIQIQYIQFILAIIPAFFIDLISPIAMSFGLTLAKEIEEVPYKKEEEIEEKVVEEKKEEPKKEIKEEIIETPDIQDDVPLMPPQPFHSAFEAPVPIFTLDTEKDIPKQKRKYTRREKPETVTLAVETTEDIDRLLPKEELENQPITVEQIEKSIEVENVEQLEEKIQEPVVEQPKEEVKSPFIKPSEQKTDLEEIENNQEELIHYKFGKTTESIMKKLIDFVGLCIRDEGEFNMHPDYAASQLKLGNRAKQVFIDRLLAIRLGSKTLITKNKYGEYFSNYSSKQIIDYVSSIKND